ncbi:unnamed protein product, partial [Nesidiocoris tenuis]
MFGFGLRVQDPYRISWARDIPQNPFSLLARRIFPYSRLAHFVRERWNLCRKNLYTRGLRAGKKRGNER